MSTEGAQTESPEPAAPSATTAEGLSAPIAGARAPLTLPVAMGLAAVAGTLYYLAFPSKPENDLFSPLAFIAYVPLLFAIRGQTPKRAFWLGSFAGLAMSIGGFYWLWSMMKTFSGFPDVLCFLFLLILSSYHGLRWGILTWLARRGEERRWEAWLTFSAAFVATELLFPLLFPWYFGACAHKWSALMQAADVGGPILVGLVLLGVNLSIFELVTARIEKRPLRPRLAFGGFGILLFSAAYGYGRLRKVDADVQKAERVKVGLVQPNMGLMQKRTSFSEGMRRHLSATQALKKQGAELVVWSESSAMEPKEVRDTDQYRVEFTRALGIPLIFGAVLYSIGPDRERLYNTALATDSSGKILSRYDKRYLLAFGEYLPFGDTFPILYQWSPHSGKFTHGDAILPTITKVNGQEHHVGTLICYEDILPGFTNDIVHKTEPELLVNITNDAWFGDTSEPWEHFALSKFRAIEHHRYFIRSTNSGVSAIVDPVGRTIFQTHPFKEESGMAEVRWMKGSTPFEFLGEWPWFAVSLFSFFAAFRRRKSAAEVHAAIARAA